MNENDPFAPMCGAPWMNRRLSPSGRAAAFPLPASPVRRGRWPKAGGGAPIEPTSMPS